MSQHQTSKAKSTSLIVLLLLCLAGLGNKACKSVHLPARFRAEVAAPTAPKPSATAPFKKVVYRHELQSGKDSQTTQGATTVARVAPIRRSNTTRLSKSFTPTPDTTTTLAELPQIQSASADEEIAELNRRFRQASVKPEHGFDSARIWQKLAVEGGQVLENTGSSYFNSEVEPNMNDIIKSAFTARFLYDSVVSPSNKDFVYNTLTIGNTTTGQLDIQVMITSPTGWQMVTTNIINISLEPFGNTIIPMRFSPVGANTSGWQQAKVEYRVNNIIDTRKSYFKMKVQEYSGFKAMLPNSNLVLTGYQKHVSIPVYLKNAGNTSGTYHVAVNNQLLKLGAKIDLTVAAGKDTTLLVPFTLSESQFAMLKKEDVKVTVTNASKENINLIQSVSKVGHILKDHSSAFLDMPLQLEAGAMYSGSDVPVQYYGALYGTVDFTENDHLSMSLRSNTIARGQTNQNSMIRFDYSGKHFQASAGNIQGAGEFMVDGYGARVGYQWNTANKAEVFGMLQSRVGDSKVFGGALHLGLGDKVRISDAISISTDNIRKMNSGILSQVSEFNYRDAKFSLITGVGAEQNNNYLPKGTSSTMTGTSLGYNFQLITKRIAAVSNVLMNSNSYPGLFKGQRLQLHDVRLLKGNNFIGGYYEYNFRKQDYWMDTILKRDMFNMRTTNYGVRGGINIKNSNIVLAAGNQKQLQAGYETFQTSYNYLNLNVSSLIAKKLYVNITSFAGYISGTGDGPKEKAFVSTTQGNLQYKSYGLSFRYDNGPYYYQEYVNYVKKPEKFERLIFSPFAEVRLMKNALSARVQGNFARMLPANVSNSSVLANINYSHPKGYDFNLNGIVPLGGSSQSYLNATFRMKLKTPFVAVRKYHNLKLVLFKDKNSNGVKDAGEEPVAGQTLSLNGDLFVSDGNGTILYKNTEKGIYKADFGYSSSLKGWIPSDGPLQSFELASNKTIEVPYKVSRILSGKLLVEADELSNTPFNPAKIKVSASDENGEVYSTLTDDKGEFHFNLPSGNYVVSLSEIAFGDQFRPVQFSQTADLRSNQLKNIYFEIKQKRRQINIKRK